MVELRTEVKRWGNSFGLIIPNEIVRREKLKPKQKVTVLLLKESNVLKKTFGMAKKWKTPTKQILKQTDRELYND